MNPKKKILRTLKKNGQGLSISELAKKTNLHRHTVSRYILELKAKEVINIRKIGPTKLCFFNGNEKTKKGFSSFIPIFIIASALLFSAIYIHQVQPLQDNQIEPEVKILNPQSYPSQYGKWTMNFITNGTSDLKITPIQGTDWSDLKPLNIKCGEEAVDFERKGSSVVLNDYHCSKKSKIENEVLTAGVHKLKLNFGDTTTYANNLAGQTVCGVSFDNLVYEFNDSSGDDLVTVDSSGNLYITSYRVYENYGSSSYIETGFEIGDPNDVFAFTSSRAYIYNYIRQQQADLSSGLHKVSIRNATNGNVLTEFNVGTGNISTLGYAAYQTSRANCSENPNSCGTRDQSDWNGSTLFTCNITSGSCVSSSFEPDTNCSTVCKGLVGDAACKRYSDCSEGDCTTLVNCSSGSACNHTLGGCAANETCDTTTHCEGVLAFEGLVCDGDGNCDQTAGIGGACSDDDTTDGVFEDTPCGANCDSDEDCIGSCVRGIKQPYCQCEI